jgi:AcrR family transcriptional regulator
MPIEKPSPAPLKKSDRTRAAILDAAQRLFAERGHAATTIRDVAAEAGIDPALVMRYFGSKDELFVRAAAFELDLPALDKLDRDSVGEELLRHFLGVWEGPRANAGMAILLRSAASNELSADKMREVFATQVLPGIARLGTRATAGRRAGLVATQLLGLALCRYVLAIPPVAQLTVEELVREVAPTIQRYALGE